MFYGLAGIEIHFNGFEFPVPWKKVVEFGIESELCSWTQFSSILLGHAELEREFQPGEHRSGFEGWLNLRM
jgi:hypothetical protein